MDSLINKWKLPQNIDFAFIYKVGAILITISLIFFVDYFKVPNPAIICLIGVVFSAFVGGYLYGTISGILTLIYCMYFFQMIIAYYYIAVKIYIK